MLQITLKELKDFQICERLYDFKYKQLLPEKIGGRQLLLSKFESNIKSVVGYFFYKKQQGNPPSKESLKNRWEKLWFPKTSSFDIIYEQHEIFHANKASLTTKADIIFEDLIENFGAKDIIPIGINEEYSVPITSNVAIVDKFDLIYSKNKKIYIIKWVFNHRSKYESGYVFDFAFMSAAFNHKFENKKNNPIFGYFDLMNPKSGLTEFITEKADINALEYWCTALHEEKVFPSRRGLTFYCKSCPFDKPCSKWVAWRKEDK